MKLRTAFTRVAFVLTLIAPLVFGLAQAQEASEPRDILIRNATLLDPGGTGADRMVSLLVRNGELEIVTDRLLEPSVFS